jgi:hypothetical protein
MNNFKVGDEVVCVQNAEPCLTVGKTYKIRSIVGNWLHMLDDLYCVSAWNQSQFKPKEKTMEKEMEKICVGFANVPEKLRVTLSEHIQEVAFKAGYKWKNGQTKYMHLDGSHPYFTTMFFHFNDCGEMYFFYDIDDSTMRLDALTDYNEIVERLNQFRKPIIITLNSEYSAECTKEGIKIRHQTFDWEIVDKLVEAKKELKSEK